jgi:hypothetical protein
VVFFDYGAFQKAMLFGENEQPDAIIAHIMTGLAREQLISDSWAIGSAATIKKDHNFDVAAAGVIFTPANIGIELYYWAHGCGDLGLHRFLDPDITFEPLANFELEGGFDKPRKLTAPLK